MAFHKGLTNLYPIVYPRTNEGTEHTGDIAVITSKQITLGCGKDNLEKRMPPTYAGNDFRTGVIHHAPTSITITSLTGLRGLVGLTTVCDASQAWGE